MCSPVRLSQFDRKLPSVSSVRVRALSGRVRCRAAGDSVDASARPFESQPMHRRKQYGHGFGEACSCTIDEEVAPTADIRGMCPAAPDRRSACRRRIRRGSAARQSLETSRTFRAGPTLPRLRFGSAIISVSLTALMKIFRDMTQISVRCSTSGIPFASSGCRTTYSWRHVHRQFSHHWRGLEANAPAESPEFPSGRRGSSPTSAPSRRHTRLSGARARARRRTRRRAP
jgi:hypothetical protein